MSEVEAVESLRSFDSQIISKKSVNASKPPKGVKKGKICYYYNHYFISGGHVVIFKNISAERRKEQFPNDSFIVDANNKKVLFCQSCKQPVSTKKSTILNHISSAKHVELLEKFKNKSKANSVQEFVNEYIAKNKMDMITIDNETKLFRFKTLLSFVESGIPLEKLNDMREYLEEVSNRSLSDSSHIRRMINIVKEYNENKIVNRIYKKFVSICFDSTPYCNEIFGVVCSFVDDDLSIVSLLISVQSHFKSFNSASNIVAINNAIKEKNIDSNNVISFISDGVSYNVVSQ